MKRSHTLGFLLLISVFFLLTQLYLLYIYINKTQKLLPTGEFQQEEDHPSTQDSYSNIADVTSALADHGMPAFLIDSTVLYSIVNGSLYKEACQFLCHDKPVTTLAVLGVLWKHNENLISHFRQKNFDVVFCTEQDPRLLSLSTYSPSQHIPTHYLFQRHSHVVQVVVLYDRGNAFWWFGGLLKNDNAQLYGDTARLNFSILEPNYSTQAGLLDRIEMVKITIDGLQLRAPRYPVHLLKQVPHSTFLECNYTRAKEFYRMYGWNNITEANTFRKVAVEILTSTSEVLNSLGIPFWISSGTCLGWFRQCDTIAHSQDVDIGIWIKDYNGKLIPSMKEKGFHLKHIFGKVSDSFELSFQAGGLKLDIFFFYEEEFYMWNGATQTISGKKFKYAFSKFVLCWTLFWKMKIRVPCDTLTYITANYGDAWYEQIKEWDWKSSPPNVQPNGQWPISEWPEVIQEFGDPLY